MSLRRRVERLESTQRHEVDARYKVVIGRLFDLLTDDEVLALAEGLTADIEGTWAELPAATQELACVALQRMHAEATPAELAILEAGC